MTTKTNGTCDEKRTRFLYDKECFSCSRVPPSFCLSFFYISRYVRPTTIYATLLFASQIHSSSFPSLVLEFNTTQWRKPSPPFVASRTIVDLRFGTYRRQSQSPHFLLRPVVCSKVTLNCSCWLAMLCLFAGSVMQVPHVSVINFDTEH